VVGGIERVGVVTTANGTAKFTLKSVPSPGSQLLDFDPPPRSSRSQDPGGNTLLTNQTPDGEDPPGSKVKERASLTPTAPSRARAGAMQFREAAASRTSTSRSRTCRTDRTT
jgi:hypothetical protein